LSLKIPLETMVFQSKEVVPLETIKRSAKLSVITEPSSIWVIGTNWGVIWKALQIKIEESGQMEDTTSFAFMEDDQ